MTNTLLHTGKRDDILAVIDSRCAIGDTSGSSDAVKAPALKTRQRLPNMKWYNAHTTMSASRQMAKTEFTKLTLDDHNFCQYTVQYARQRPVTVTKK